ncbi:MAG: hypothetical protein ACI4OI_07315, partial [Gemmiger sp.]
LNRFFLSPWSHINCNATGGRRNSGDFTLTSPPIIVTIKARGGDVRRSDGPILLLFRQFRTLHGGRFARHNGQKEGCGAAINGQEVLNFAS